MRLVLLLQATPQGGKAAIPASDCGSVLTCAKPGEHFRERLGADVEIFAHATPEHWGGHVVIASFLLRLVEDVQHDPFLARQAIADVGDVFSAHTGMNAGR